MSVIFPAETWAVYVRKVQAVLETEMGPFLKDEMRRLLEMIVDLTPPGTTDQGAKAVRRDIALIATPLLANTFHSPRVVALIERRDVAAFQAFAQNVPSFAGAKIISASEVPEIHRQNRDNRGRVRIKSALPNYVWGHEDIRALAGYVAHKVGNVGMAIAGWLPALYYLGGAVSKPVSILDVPEHGGFTVGDNPAKPSIDAINSTPWAARRDEGQRIIGNARAARINALMARFKYITESVMKSSGSHQAA